MGLTLEQEASTRVPPTNTMSGIPPPPRGGGGGGGGGHQIFGSGLISTRWKVDPISFKILYKWGVKKILEKLKQVSIRWKMKEKIGPKCFKIVKWQILMKIRPTLDHITSATNCDQDKPI